MVDCAFVSFESPRRRAKLVAAPLNKAPEQIMRPPPPSPDASGLLFHRIAIRTRAPLPPPPLSFSSSARGVRDRWYSESPPILAVTTSLHSIIWSQIKCKRGSLRGFSNRKISVRLIKRPLNSILRTFVMRQLQRVWFWRLISSDYFFADARDSTWVQRIGTNS